MAQERPQRPVVTRTFANQLFNTLYFEGNKWGSGYIEKPSKNYPGFMDYERRQPFMYCDWWTNSLSGNPKCGVRKMRIRFFGGSNYHYLQPLLPEPHVAELWLADMQQLIEQAGATEYVKVYRHMGVPSLAIWYRSNT